MKKNILIVGFMGTGKSETCRRAARQLGWTAVDMDERIQERAGKSISEIFADDGEPAFRCMERELAAELARGTNQVIAAGGGLVLDPANLSAFDSTGVVVCLQADPKTILRRVAAAQHRPLLEDGEKGARIRALLEERRALYAAVPLQVDTTPLSPDEVADEVLRLYRKHG